MNYERPKEGEWATRYLLAWYRPSPAIIPTSTYLDLLTLRRYRTRRTGPVFDSPAYNPPDSHPHFSLDFSPSWQSHQSQPSSSTPHCFFRCFSSALEFKACIRHIDVRETSHVRAPDWSNPFPCKCSSPFASVHLHRAPHDATLHRCLFDRR